MQRLRKLFGNFKMTWFRVIIFAIIAGVYTGLINQVPFLLNTSFRDIAVAFECWILFAIFIIVNCKKWWEAVLKCFVFFLISQPLVYLVEVPFIGWEVFRYYPYWGFWTLLTIPGSFIAYWVTKKNILSAVILSVATGFLVFSGVEYFNIAIYNFPNHIFSAIFCIAQAVFLILVLLPKKRERIIAFALTAAVFLCVAYSVFFSSSVTTLSTSLDSSHTWTCQNGDESLVQVEITNGCNVTLYSNRNGSTELVFTNELGEKEYYDVTVSGANHMIDMIMKE